MKRYAAHGCAFLQPAVASGEGQLQKTRHQFRVIKEHLVEVTKTEKQDTVLVLFFDTHVLLHHR